MIKGIDISEHQGKIDFSKVKSCGIQFVIIRCGYGRTSEDMRFIEYVNASRQAGIPIHGVYHFIYAVNDSEALQNAENAIRLVKKAGLPSDTRIWCDVEYDTISNAKKRGVNLGNEQINRFTKIFCDTIVKAGYKTGIYLNNDYRRTKYYASTLDERDLWLADYTGDPDVPCLYQQYSESGSVSGISGRVDMNYYFGISEAVKKKSTKEVVQEVIEGKYGNGEDRVRRLKEQGYDPVAIQKAVNELFKKKSVTDIAKEVIEGKWGNGSERKRRLEQAGYNYIDVQKTVNQLLS